YCGWLGRTAKNGSATDLVARDRGIHFGRPGQNASAQIVNLAETRLAQEVHRFRGTLAATAVGHDFVRRIEFVYAARQFAERNEMPAKIANLKFMWLAHIEDVKIVAGIEALLEFARGDFRNVEIVFRFLFAADAAKFVVINQLFDAAMRAARRAVG